jgi:tripartite-type tricarboxylate transporter receptor subunit TctC
VLGYPATRDIELALERGEVQCIAATFEILRRDPSQAWLKNGFIHVLVQGGPRRHPLLPEVPTIYELMDRHKTGDDIKRVAGVLLSHGDFGRPMLAPPGMPADRLQILREAYRRTVTSPEFIAEAEKREWVVEYTSGEELEALAKKTVGQPREVVERLKKMAAE